MGTIGKSLNGRDIECFKLGHGKLKVLIAGGFHANEWLTTEALRGLVRDFCCVKRSETSVLYKLATLYIVPEVNPDGIAIVRGSAAEKEIIDAKNIALSYPDIPFPDGWKANARGVDINLNFPAGWATAREIKSKLGFASPAPRDFPGSCPLSEPESIAIAGFTEKICPDMILAFHSQGRVIYWKYLDIEVAGSWEIASAMARATGYEAELTPYVSGHAGYKDWFILKYCKPGFTIELGEGENPLPLGDYPQILQDSERIVLSAVSALSETPRN